MLDGYWPDPPLPENKNLIVVRKGVPMGMRDSINRGVAIATGKYIMKCDDHCAFSDGFDVALKKHHEDNWITIPSRYSLDPIKWEPTRGPINYMYLTFPFDDHELFGTGFHGTKWHGEQGLFGSYWHREHERKKTKIDDLMIFQGSCYFMTKDYFGNFLGGLSEVGYGQFAQEAQEIGFKTWLGGGAVKVNKKTWYAHLYKGRRYGRMYRVSNFDRYTKEASEWSADYWLNNKWEGRVHDFEWFIDVMFPGMPSWPSDWKKQIKEMGWVK